jgi:type I restriction enzyme S subunit
MEVKKGYKKTEVGVIPNDWEVDEIQNVADITTGDKNTQDRITDGAYPFFVRSQTVERINSFSFDGEAVLTAGDGVGTGKVFHYINGKFDFHQRVYKISNFSERLDGYFFYVYFSKNFYNRIMQMTAKSSVDSVRREMIAKMLIPLPTKAEQTAIATALNDADALITSIEKLIAKKRNIKQGAMQELLRPKEGWVVKRLGDFLDYEQPTKYLVVNTEYNDHNQTPVLTAGKSFILGYTNEEFGVFKNLPVIIFDDFTTTSKFVDFPFKVKSSAMKMLKPKNEKVNLRFVFELMQTIKFDSTDHKRYWISEYQNIEIKVPKPEDQTRIAQILSDMDAEIEALEKKLEKYKMLKQGMMQELLTGRIRLV